MSQINHKLALWCTWMSQPWPSATPAIFCNPADGNLGNLGNPDQLDNTLAGWREGPSTDGQHMHLLPSLTWAGAILDGRISKK